MSDSLTTVEERTVMPELSSNGHAESGQAVRSKELLGHVTVLFVMKDSLYKTLGLDCYDA